MYGLRPTSNLAALTTALAGTAALVEAQDLKDRGPARARAATPATCVRGVEIAPARSPPGSRHRAAPRSLSA